MTKEQMRIVVAEIMGWRHWFNGWNKLDDNTPPLTLTQDLPNYPEDLNACYEAWCSLNVEQHKMFKWHLQIIVQRDGRVAGPCRSISNATAPQRTEAFIRLHGRWID